MILVDESRTLNVVYLDFSKDFDTVSRKIPLRTARLTQRDGEVFNTGYIPEPSERDPGPSAPGDAACTGRLGHMTSRGLFCLNRCVILSF